MYCSTNTSQRKLKTPNEYYSILVERGKKQPNPKDKKELNPFVQNYIDEKKRKTREFENSLNEQERSRLRNFRKFILETIGSKGGLYVGNKDFKKKGIRYKDTETVLNFSYLFTHRIQLNNTDFTNAIILDLDIPFYSAAVWKYEGLPEPSLIVVNNVEPSKPIQDLTEKEIDKLGIGKCHYIYLLEKPVRMTGGGGYKVINYLKAVQRALTLKSGADPSFNNRITKNPLNCVDYTTIWHSSGSLKKYTLDELAENLYLPRRDEVFYTIEQADDLGRNVAIFNTVRRKAYRLISKWESTYTAFYNEIHHLTESFADYTPNYNGEKLDYKEVKTIAKSISKFCWNILRNGKKDKSFLDYSYGEGRKIADKKRAKSIKVRQKKAEEKELKLKQDILEGKTMNISIADISRRYKITPKKVKELLSELDITPPSREDYLKNAHDKRLEAYNLRQQGLKYREIAEKMNISLSHAKNLVTSYKPLEG
ncbi:hypothetical protein BKG92_07175 [Rodentibacter ratti]|uniref:Uncharacterized protein n=1 Tax=Rodentibacter ratti TaxID=1906745 RepID=A0A1V3KWU0_9PAST|nr:replication initiation protein [Rodentibacter ratti]OOF82166.1 hypothetical protein BKG92_07175 [Rodentibacter ratti]